MVTRATAMASPPNLKPPGRRVGSASTSTRAAPLLRIPAISMAGEAAKTMPASSGAVSFIACVVDDVTRETVSRAVAHLGWSDAKVRAGGIETAARSIDNASDEADGSAAGGHGFRGLTRHTNSRYPTQRRRPS